MSELTSLKVPVYIRDRLATAARARGLSVRALLDELSRQAADDALMARAAAEMARLRESDPQEWTRYLDEGRSWEQGTVAARRLTAAMCGWLPSTRSCPGSRVAPGRF